MTAESAFPENKLDTLGLFSWNPSSPGSKLGRAEQEDRINGRQFTTRPAKAGLGPDVTFTRFTSIHVGDVFMSPEQRRRAYDKEKRKHQLVPAPFKPTSPPQKPSGQGTFSYGVFKPYPYMKVSDEYDHGAPFRPKPAPKNFYTSPSKKGSYGTTGKNIGGKLDGVCGEYEYIASPPIPKQQRPRSEHSQAFSPSSPSKKGTHGYIGLNMGGTATGMHGEFGYQSDGRYDSHFKNSKYVSLGQPTKPFVPSRLHKEEPETEVFDMERTKKLEERSKIIGGVFRPAGVPKSIRSPSVLNMKANQYRRNW